MDHLRLSSDSGSGAVYCGASCVLSPMVCVVSAVVFMFSSLARQFRARGQLDGSENSISWATISHASHFILRGRKLSPPAAQRGRFAASAAEFAGFRLPS